MSCESSFWLRVPLTKQLKWANVGHGEATINNAATVITDKPYVLRSKSHYGLVPLSFHDYTIAYMFDMSVNNFSVMSGQRYRLFYINQYVV